jgi:hypothetical protein
MKLYSEEEVRLRGPRPRRPLLSHGPYLLPGTRLPTGAPQLKRLSHAKWGGAEGLAAEQQRRQQRRDARAAAVSAAAPPPGVLDSPQAGGSRSGGSPTAPVTPATSVAPAGSWAWLGLPYWVTERIRVVMQLSGVRAGEGGGWRLRLLPAVPAHTARTCLVVNEVPDASQPGAAGDHNVAYTTCPPRRSSSAARRSAAGAAAVEAGTGPGLRKRPRSSSCSPEPAMRPQPQQQQPQRSCQSGGLQAAAAQAHGPARSIGKAGDVPEVLDLCSSSSSLGSDAGGEGDSDVCWDAGDTPERAVATTSRGPASAVGAAASAAGAASTASAQAGSAAPRAWWRRSAGAASFPPSAPGPAYYMHPSQSPAEPMDRGAMGSSDPSIAAAAVPGAAGSAEALASGAARGEFVLYWMKTALRGHENPALDAGKGPSAMRRKA